LNALVGYLKIFYDATKKLSGTNYPALNIFFIEFYEVYLTIKRMESFSFPFIVQMGKEMYKKWDKYWSSGSALLTITCVLDPRCKMTIVEHYYQAIPMMTVRGLLHTSRLA
jgi:Domain of unknown function (DUF4413)